MRIGKRIAEDGLHLHASLGQCNARQNGAEHARQTQFKKYCLRQFAIVQAAGKEVNRRQQTNCAKKQKIFLGYIHRSN